MRGLRPRRSGRGHLFRRYTAIFVGLVGCSLVVSGVVQAFFSYQDNRDAILRTQADSAAAAATGVENYVEQTTDALITAVQQADPRSRPTYTTILTPAERREDYRQVLLRVPAVTEISYLDRTGRVQLRVSRLTAHVVASADYGADQRFLVPRSGGIYYGATYFRSSCGRLTAGLAGAPVVECQDELAQPEPDMTLAVPYEPGVSYVGTAENVGGVTVAEVNLSAVQELIAQIRPAGAGYAYLVDSRGQLVARRPGAGLFPQADLGSLDQVRAALAGVSRPSSGTATAHDLQGRDVLTAYHSIVPTRWSVFVEQPLDEAFSPLHGFLVRTALLLVVGLALAMLASIFFARRMTTPILALERAAGRIGAGQLEERIEIGTRDELADLAQTFNHMAAQLGESYRGLEQKVADRTRELAETSRQLEVASRHKSEFLANMSHELRTPLNAVIGFSEVLLERLFGELNEKQSEYLADIHTSGGHLLSLINDVLDLSKIEAGRMDLQLNSFALAEVVESSVAMLRERAMRQGIALRTQLEATTGVVEADERKLKQVLFNLLTNAVKFTPSGGHVDVAAHGDEATVSVSVRDDGIGIAEEDQARIFEEFEQAGALRVQEGTGLGLALSRRFIELHGGRMWVESTVGQGSTFAFTMPRSQPAAATETSTLLEGSVAASGDSTATLPP